jgi:hypothetical protein
MVMVFADTRASPLVVPAAVLARVEVDVGDAEHAGVFVSALRAHLDAGEGGSLIMTA